MSQHPIESEYSALSPFQLKDELIRSARDSTRQKAATHQFLDAGRGNPNWVATTPREAYFLLGQFALTESKRVWDEPDIGGMPRASGIAGRLRDFLARVETSHGADLLSGALDYATSQLRFDADAFVHELTDAAIGDNYPVPDRMLVHCEVIVRRYLAKTMCDDRPPPGNFDLFAVEGGTAAMCYVFSSLVANGLLHRGDTIALGTPIFTPYLEIPELDEFNFATVDVQQSEMAPDGRHSWQYPDAELAKLEDPRIKAFFLVNPSNPSSFAIRRESIDRIVSLVRNKRPDLIILTDDVYGTFIEGFRSLAAELPRNTILVYSFSKYFGCTGWRLGVVALHEDNVIDRAIARLPVVERERLRRRYGTLSTEPDRLKFIDRMVAESRLVALNHTAGLSLPQQLQMTLFSLFSLLDADDSYGRRCRAIVRERYNKLFEGLGMPVPPDPLRVGYYADLDLAAWGRHTFGEEFMDYVVAHHDPLDIVLELAKRHGTVLLNGSGFDGPPWSARVSLANLDAQDYVAIGRDLREIARAAVARWRRSAGGPTRQ
jgi:aspartate 4-decarboxylase